MNGDDDNNNRVIDSEEEQTKTDEILMNDADNVWIVDDENAPSRVFVEGKNAGTSTLYFAFFNNVHRKVYEDRIVFTVIRPRLIPDFNHDRTITEEDYAQSITNGPFRFWINDDDDESADEGNDVPGDGSPDSGNDEVDSVRDLIDFFPVYVDLTNTLKLLGTANYNFSIHLEGDPLFTYPRLGLVYTDLTPESAGKYLTNATVAVSIAGESVEQFGYNNNVVDIPESFLQDIRDDGKGVVLIEAGTATLGNRLVVEIKDSNNQSIGSMGFSLETDTVELMFRHKNLRSVSGGFGGKADRLSEPPNYPDSLCNDKDFVFVHGYNVDGTAARGWQSEFFKRLYWSGSKARFHGISWYGNKTQVPIIKKTPNYHINVTNAFEAAPALATYINSLNGSVTLAAHSLGNMVSSFAIQDHAANVAQYYMIDAAVSLEAYDAGLQESLSVGWEEMLHCSWRSLGLPSEPPLYNRRLWASDWYKLFLGTTDERRKLAWRNRFSSIAGVGYNFYSSGEDVLENFDGGDGCFFVWEGGLGRGAWVKQEKLKGRMLFNLGGSDYGGWGFNAKYGYWSANLVNDTNVLTDAMLKTDPFFLPGPNRLNNLYDATSGSAYAATHHGELLGGMIPALTYSAGANHIQLFDTLSGEDRNFDMNSESFQKGWPRTNQDWLHGDIREIAYQYIFNVYGKFVKIGGLDQ